MYKNTDEIMVIFPKNQYIPPFHMNGPLASPRRCSLADVYTCVCAGVEVHQYDPNTKATVKITAANVYDDNKFANINPATGAVKTPLDGFTTPAPTTVTQGVTKTAPNKEEAPVKDDKPTAEELVDAKTDIGYSVEESGELDDDDIAAETESEVAEVEDPVEEPSTEETVTETKDNKKKK